MNDANQAPPSDAWSSCSLVHAEHMVWYVMPRRVARYFIGRHRRRVPTASTYISGCTVNPSGPAVRQLHQGRSPEFQEWSSPTTPLLASPSYVSLFLSFFHSVPFHRSYAPSPLFSRSFQPRPPAARFLFLPDFFFLISTVSAVISRFVYPIARQLDRPASF